MKEPFKPCVFPLLDYNNKLVIVLWSVSFTNISYQEFRLTLNFSLSMRHFYVLTMQIKLLLNIFVHVLSIFLIGTKCNFAN